MHRHVGADITGEGRSTMRPNRHLVAAMAGGAALLVGGGAAVAAAEGEGDKGAGCEARLAKIAEKRGVSVEQLEAQVRERLTARVDAALQAGRISPERAARLKERIAEGNLCRAAHHRRAKLGARRLLATAAGFLGLERAELRAQLPGTSLAALAEKQGKSVADLKAAMLDPVEAKLAMAVAAQRITQERADLLLERIEQRVDRLVTKVFPTKDS
jgi:hypothetical protein